MTIIDEATNPAGTEAPKPGSLRLVREDDLLGLEVLDKEVFDDLAYSMHYMRTFYNLFRTTWYVVECDDIAGYALVGANSDSSEAWLLGLAVRWRYQGRGLGRKLMKKSLTVMMEAGVGDTYITVRPDNAAAYRLYQEFGFKQVGDELEDYYGNGERRKVLHRSLAHDPYIAD